MVAEGSDALGVQELCHLVCLCLEGAVHNDRGHTAQGLLLQQLQNSPFGCTVC